jgi:hypothetical protein
LAAKRKINRVSAIRMFPVAVAILVGVLGHSANLGFKTFLLISKGGRLGGGLKIDWTKPLPSAWPMCIDCGLDLV